MKTTRNNRLLLLITSLIILAPMAFGLAQWNRLPDSIATSFDFSGAPNDWSGKPFAVVGLPTLLLSAHLICALIVRADPKRGNIGNRIFRLILLICPAVSIFCGVLIYGNALSLDVDATLLGHLFLAALLLTVGNYLPKCRQNYTVGIELPWTLDDPENWNRTHRMAGWLWMAAGLIALANAFLRLLNGPFLFGMIGLAALTPAIYSYALYRRHGD